MNVFTQECSTKLFFLAGALNEAKDGFIGTFTIEQIKKFKFDLAFIGVVGIDLHEEEVTTYSVDDGITKKEVINSSGRCVRFSGNCKIKS